MAFPTATVTPGTGLTINTLPNAGQVTMANSLPVVLASDQSAVPVSAASLPLPSGAATAAGLATINTTLGTPLQAGGSIGNTAFGISGTLPAFAATPTVNIGTAPSIAVTGTFWQATQPVSLTALPALPAGSNTIGTVNVTSAAATGSAVPTLAELVGVSDQSGNLRGLSGAIFHNADNQALTGTSFGLVTGGVGQVINSAGNLDRVREGYADAMAITGFAGNIGMLYNGTTYDRNRSASGDGLAITGVQAASDVLWNGTSFDRPRAVAGDGMAGTGLAAEADMLWNGTTYDRPRTAGAAQATTGTGVAAEAAFGVYNTSAPTLTAGQYSAVQMDASGNVLVNLKTALPAGTNAIGSIVGRPVLVAPTLTVTAASAYAANNCVGGVVDLGVIFDASDLSAYLQSIVVASASAQTSNLAVALFNASPSGSTLTDKTAASIAAADAGKLLGIYPLFLNQNATYFGSIVSLWESDALSTLLISAGTHLWAAFVTLGTPTFTATTDFKPTFRFAKGA
jgi:hypothetical protein